MTHIDESLLERDSPKTLQIEVTSRCNLTCKMCPLTTGETLSGVHPGHMREALWEEILPLAKRVGNVTLTGYGEPFLNPRFLPLLRELNQAKVVVGLSTNGTPITKSVAQELATLEYVAHYNFSIDSPIQRSYGDIRGGKVDKALKGLGNLMAVINDPTKVTVSSVLMAQNLQDLVHSPKILAGLGVKKLLLQGLMDYTDSCPEAQLLRNPELFAYLDQIHDRGAEFDVEIEMLAAERMLLERHRPREALRRFHQPVVDPQETKQCSVPWEVPFIDREGRVFPCCNASKDAAAIMGDLRRDSWDNLWNGPRFREFRRRLLDGMDIPEICRRCNAANGKHPLLYAGRIRFDQSRLTAQDHIRVVVQNVGRHTWTEDDPIRIATTSPRDRLSELAHHSWLSPNRPAGFRERRVPPGELATFEFAVMPKAFPVSEPFALVYDGLAWMLDTDFTVTARSSTAGFLVAAKNRWKALRKLAPV